MRHIQACGIFIVMTETEIKGAGVDRLFETGAHFAQVKSRRHPSMKKFVLGTTSKVEIFDLAKTDEQIAKAKTAMAALARDGKVVLFVGGKREVSDEVRAAATRPRSGSGRRCQGIPQGIAPFRECSEPGGAASRDRRPQGARRRYRT